MTANQFNKRHSSSLLSLAAFMGLVAWPFISFLASNTTEALKLRDIAIPWIGYQLCILAILLITSRLLKEILISRLLIVLGFLSATFFSFGVIAHLLMLIGVQKGTIWLGVWAVIFFLVGWLSWIFSKKPSASFVAFVIATALIIWPSIQLAYGGLKGKPSAPQTAGTSKIQGGLPLRNVYWFLLDGYVRSDSLKIYFNHDNRSFLDFLTSHNFEIADFAYSNYDNTSLSLTSTLTAHYQQLPNTPRPETSIQISTLSGFNPVVHKFTSLGYRYIHAPYGGSAKTQCGGNEHRCIRARPSGRIPLNEAQVSLLQLTPLFRIFRRLFKDAFQYDHVFVDDIISNIQPSRERPFFLFAHILSPHAPPRFTPDCKRIEGVTDPVDIGSSAYDPNQFRIDTVCTNRSLVEAITYIQTTDKTDPIIIIQGDHGFKFRLPGESIPDPNKLTQGSEPFRRLAILNAIRLPHSCKSYFYESISPINTFPLVFACLEGTQPKYKKDQHFLRPWGASGQVVAVDPSPF